MYTFGLHLLFATQFAQIALAVTEKAAFEDMHVKGFVQKDCAFTGHIFGEYSVPASITDVLPISPLVGVALYYHAMCRGPTIRHLRWRVALQTMANVLNHLGIREIDIAKLMEIFITEKEMLGDIIESCYKEAHQQSNDNHLQLDVFPTPGQSSSSMGAREVGQPRPVPNMLACIILVELLTYQFVSPVRWIETQDRLFSEFAFEHLIELGPSSPLTGMATRTFKAEYETGDDSISRTRIVLCRMTRRFITNMRAGLDPQDRKRQPLRLYHPLHLLLMEKQSLGSMALWPHMLNSLVSPSLPLARVPSEEGGGGGGATIDSEELPQFQADQEKFVVQHVELYMRYLDCDSRVGEIAFDQERASNTALQTRVDNILHEHGDLYINEIQPRFDPLKAHFDPSRNRARQDALLMYHDIIFSRLTTVGREITARCIATVNQTAVREDIRKPEAYVEEMAGGDTVSGAISNEKDGQDYNLVFSNGFNIDVLARFTQLSIYGTVPPQIQNGTTPSRLVGGYYGLGEHTAKWLASVAWSLDDGNLTRPGHSAITDRVWPYRACSCPGSDHPGPDVSKMRGVLEIDILEAEKGKDAPTSQVVSQSAQFGPFLHDYFYGNTSANMWDVYMPDRTRPLFMYSRHPWRDKRCEGHTETIYLRGHPSTPLAPSNLGAVVSRLDLSSFYGGNREDAQTIRRYDGSGELAPDSFTAAELDSLPAYIQLLLILWNQNHNETTTSLAGGVKGKTRFMRSVSPGGPLAPEFTTTGGRKW
ncbi:hypothetical protein BD779DRAFT_1480567 [Infundibulicybe gibba]|nr:hypothetical protein BD779DRAFT_1480567 [Infundibulicybe gibba]